jgi:hypothetical protein
MNHRIPRQSIILVASLSCIMTASGVAASNAANAGGSDDALTTAGVIATRVSTVLRNCEFERREEFVATYKAMHDNFAANLEQLRATHSAALASPKRNEAMAKLDADNAAFEQKLSDAEDATVETWNAARDSVAASWDTLQATYAEVSDGG